MHGQQSNTHVARSKQREPIIQTRKRPHGNTQASIETMRFINVLSAHITGQMHTQASQTKYYQSKGHARSHMDRHASRQTLKTRCRSYSLRLSSPAFSDGVNDKIFPEFHESYINRTDFQQGIQISYQFNLILPKFSLLS